MNETAAPIIETARLLLRKLSTSDANHLEELDADPEVMRFISFGQPTPREVVRDVYLPRMMRSYELGPQFGFWSAELRDTRQWIGWFHLRPEKQAPYEMELGYRLRRGVWGQGLATEGSMELLRRAFGLWQTPRVIAHTLAVNFASRRVMEKCGMRFVGEFVCPQEWIPGTSDAQRLSVRYQLDAQDFREPSARPPTP